MSEEKCCGTCGWGSPNACNEYTVGCTAPVAQCRGVVLESMPVRPSDGSSCPCWRPKGGEITQETARELEKSLESVVDDNGMRECWCPKCDAIVAVLDKARREMEGNRP